jgi:hypothetical protein
MSFAVEHQKAILIFCLGALFWMVLYAFIAPQQLYGDGFFFREPAINLATGYGLTTIASANNPTLIPNFYTDYPPLYAVIYAGYVKVVGVGAYQNTYFNLIAQIGRAGMLLWLSLTLIGKEKEKRWGCLLATLCAITIPISVRYDCPEDVYLMTISGSLLILIKNKNLKGWFWSAVIAGLNAMISPVAGIINFLATSGLCFYESFKTEEKYEFPLKQLGIIASGSSFIPILVMLVTIIVEPSALKEYLSRSTSSDGFGSALGTESFFQKLNMNFQYGIFGIVFFLSGLLTWALAIAISISNYLETRRLPELFWCIGVSILALFTFAIFPSKYYYIQIIATATTLITAVVSSLHFRERVTVLILGSLLIGLLSFPRIVRDISVRILSKESYVLQQQKAKALVERCSVDDYILCSTELYLLFKPTHQKTCANLPVLIKLSADINAAKYFALGYKGYFSNDAQPLVELEQEMKNQNMKLIYAPEALLLPATTVERIFLRPADLWKFKFYERLNVN